MVVNYTDDNRDSLDQLAQLEPQDPAQIITQQLMDSSSSEKSNTGNCKQSLKSDPAEDKQSMKRKLAMDNFTDLSQQATVIDEHDDSKLFCLSLISTLKRLDDRKRQLAKLKIQNALYEVEFSDPNDCNLG